MTFSLALGAWTPTIRQRINKNSWDQGWMAKALLRPYEKLVRALSEHYKNMIRIVPSLACFIPWISTQSHPLRITWSIGIAWWIIKEHKVDYRNGGGSIGIVGSIGMMEIKRIIIGIAVLEMLLESFLKGTTWKARRDHSEHEYHSNRLSLED